MDNVMCSDCKYIYEAEVRLAKNNVYCPMCNSSNVIILVNLGSENINSNFHEFSKSRIKEKGKKKPIREVFDGDDLFKKKKKWVKKRRIIDRENDTYFEDVRDENDTIHHCEEKLTEHFGHGDAKKSSL